jgi:hypothetical protein
MRDGVRPSQVHDVFGRYPVPTGHAQCCRACVDVNEAPLPAQLCEALNGCNGHGTCMFGQCQCAGERVERPLATAAGVPKHRRVDSPSSPHITPLLVHPTPPVHCPSPFVAHC